MNKWERLVVFDLCLLAVGLYLACKGPTEAKRPLALGETPAPCPTATPTATPWVPWDDRGIPGPTPTPQRCYEGIRLQAVYAVGYDAGHNRCGSFSETPP